MKFIALLLFVVILVALKTVAVAVDGFDDARVEKARGIFKSCVATGGWRTSKLSLKNFKKCLDEQGILVLQPREVFNRIDLDGSGKIDEDEFLNYYLNEVANFSFVPPTELIASVFGLMTLLFYRNNLLSFTKYTYRIICKTLRWLFDCVTNAFNEFRALLQRMVLSVRQFISETIETMTTFIRDFINDCIREVSALLSYIWSIWCLFQGLITNICNFIILLSLKLLPDTFTFIWFLITTLYWALIFASVGMAEDIKPFSPWLPRDLGTRLIFIASSFIVLRYIDSTIRIGFSPTNDVIVTQWNRSVNGDRSVNDDIISAIPFFASCSSFNINAALGYYWFLLKVDNQSSETEILLGCIFLAKISSIISRISYPVDENFLYDVFSSPIDGKRLDYPSPASLLLNFILLIIYPFCLGIMLIDFHKIGGSLSLGLWVLFAFPQLLAIFWRYGDDSVTIRHMRRKVQTSILDFRDGLLTLPRFIILMCLNPLDFLSFGKIAEFNASLIANIVESIYAIFKMPFTFLSSIFRSPWRFLGKIYRLIYNLIEFILGLLVGALMVVVELFTSPIFGIVNHIFDFFWSIILFVANFFGILRFFGFA